MCPSKLVNCVVDFALPSEAYAHVKPARTLHGDLVRNSHAYSVLFPERAGSLGVRFNRIKGRRRCQCVWIVHAYDDNRHM